ncbi:MAG: putative metalloprotease YpwA [Candidatus Heimdallarchaeota archaeon LC_2]|nr:MAG: putative metalloprotease YpwA [Candidatus Heimdallarchaeota archaeon LC_2]
MSSAFYDSLMSKFKELAMIGSLEGVLNWDSETTLPYNGVEHRTKQVIFLNDLKQKTWGSKEFGDLLQSNLKDETLNDFEKRNLELINREFLRRQKLPPDLMSKLMGQSKKTNEIWKRAKSKNQFSLVLPDLEKLFDLNNQVAVKLAELYGLDDPYDALISTRDYGFSVSKISSIFEENRKFLVPMVKNMSEKSESLDKSFLVREISKEQKQKLAETTVEFFKYKSKSDEHAVIGEVEHPLTIGCGPKDIRVTVKYEKWEKVLFSASHEVGHGIHGWNRNQEWNGLPVNSYNWPSLGECNSRYTENKIGKSREFWEYYYPTFQEVTKGKFSDIGLDQFYQVINRVEPGISRMKADEVTYGLHIIIRFEIERELFAGKVELKDLPQVWNDKYEQYLGVEVPDDTRGVLQDLHWYNVYWAYFQGYALGDIMGSQLHGHMVSQNPGWADSVRNGDFSPVYNYFVDNIYSVGAMFDPLDLIKNVTGEELTTTHFHNYLSAKYENMF